jgi:hypothetical protein
MIRTPLIFRYRNRDRYRLLQNQKTEGIERRPDFTLQITGVPTPILTSIF